MRFLSRMLTCSLVPVRCLCGAGAFVTGLRQSVRSPLLSDDNHHQLSRADSRGGSVPATYFNSCTRIFCGTELSRLAFAESKRRLLIPIVVMHLHTGSPRRLFASLSPTLRLSGHRVEDEGFWKNSLDEVQLGRTNMRVEHTPDGDSTLVAQNNGPSDDIRYNRGEYTAYGQVHPRGAVDPSSRRQDG